MQFHADLDPTSKSNADPDPALKNNADPDHEPQPCFYHISRYNIPYDCFVILPQGVPTAVPAEGDEEPGMPGRVADPH